MPKRISSILIILIGLTMTALALIGLYLGDNTLFQSSTFSLTTPEGGQLNGTYYPGSQTVAVLLVEGFGSDQVAMRSLANEFNTAGFDVFTFDFTGQGASSGGLASDFALTDRLANQVVQVENHIATLSGQRKLPLIVIGHGLGGRVALQSAVIDSHLIQGVVLIGPQVDLASNPQTGLLTETEDSSLAWVHMLNRTSPNTKILILSGAQDDILNPDEGGLLLQALTNERNAQPGPEISSPDNPNVTRQWLLFPDQVYNFEIYDSHIIDAALTWSQRVLKVNPVMPVSPVAETRAWFWVLGLLGILLAGEGTHRAIDHRIHHHTPNLLRLEIVNLRRFFLSKVVLWLAAVPLMALVAGVMLLVPLPKPIYNLYYVGFIGGYGLLMLILYRFGLLPGISGKLQFSISLKKITWRRVLYTLEINLAMLAILALFANSGWFAAPPGGVRLLWVLIFTPFTALGFWFWHLDIDLLTYNNPDTSASSAFAIFNVLLPFIIYIIVLALIGSTSGVISALVGLVILALVLLQGIITYRLTSNRWLTAILQALMLYLLILSTSALINL